MNKYCDVLEGLRAEDQEYILRKFLKIDLDHIIKSLVTELEPKYSVSLKFSDVHQMITFKCLKDLSDFLDAFREIRQPGLSRYAILKRPTVESA